MWFCDYCCSCLELTQRLKQEQTGRNALRAPHSPAWVAYRAAPEAHKARGEYAWLHKPCTLVTTTGSTCRMATHEWRQEVLQRAGLWAAPARLPRLVCLVGRLRTPPASLLPGHFDLHTFQTHTKKRKKNLKISNYKGQSPVGKRTVSTVNNLKALGIQRFTIFPGALING